jgi:CHAT domain-containing protein/tetratricopeptide (TPR) repeat protein
MRQSKKGGVAGLLALTLIAGLVGAIAADPAAAPPAQPDSRQQKQLNQLQAEIETAMRAGNFEHAVQKAEEVATLLDRWLGAKHRETANARAALQRYQAMVRLPKADREELARSFVDLATAGELHGKHEYAAAEKFFRQSWTIRRRVLGEDHPETLISCNNLAFNLDAQGKYTEAQPLLEEALSSRRRVLGEEHPSTAISCINLAFNFSAQGKYAEAQPLFEKALAISRSVLGDEHPFTALSYNGVAGNLDAQGKYVEAQPLFEKALSIRRRVRGDNDSDTAQSYNSVGMNLDAQGKHAEAQPLLEKALDIRRRVFGEDHLFTASSYNNVAVNLNAQGKYAEAQPLYEKALGIRRRVLGEEHPETATSYNNVAFNLDAQGKYAEAQPLYEKALSIRRRVLGEDHIFTATSYSNVAFNLNSQGKYAEAQPLYEKVLRISRKVLGDDHRRTANSYNNLAFNLDAQGKHAEAQPLYEKALRIYRKVLGEEHPDTAASYNNVASNLDDQGKHAEAQPLYEKALGIRRRALGEDHPDTATSYNNIAFNLNAQGKYAEAQPLFEKALDIRSRVLGQEHPETAASCNNVAFNLTAQGKYAEAQPLFEKALGICRKVLGEDHPNTVASCNNVAGNLWKQNKVAEATRLLLASLPGQEAARFCSARSGFDRAIASGERFSPQDLLAVGLASLGQPAEAFRHAEANLGRGLLDDLASHASPETSRIAALRAQLSGFDAQLLPLFGQRSLTAAAREQRERLVEERRDVLSQLTRLASDLSARQLLPLEEIRKSIPGDTALVLWVEIDSIDEHHACVLRRTGDPAWVPLPGSGAKGAWTARDRQVAHRLYGLLQDARSPEGERLRLTAALARLRLEPLRPHLAAHNGLAPVRRLLVVPTGWAALVPLEVLSDDYRISYVPSGSVFARLHQQHRLVKGSSLLALGDPVFSTAAHRTPEIPALPGSRWEVQTLARLVPKATTLLGSDASQQRLDELAGADKLKDFRLIHLATHASVDWDTPSRSCLLLARDRLPDPTDTRIGKAPIGGELSVGAIRQRWHLDADLVVVSACQTALGRGSGDGPLGFAQAFLQCGARSVVLSRWPASDTATALLMVRFYENLLAPPSRKDLKKPLGRAEALAEAKQWLRQLKRSEAQELVAKLSAGKLSDTVARLGIATLNVKEVPKLPQREHPYAHPFFWATFVLIGDPD